MTWDIGSLLVLLLVGAIAGWLAGLIMRGHGFGILGNILVGIVGAFIGGLIFGWLGISLGGGIIGAIIAALVGAIVLLAIAGLFRRA